MCCQLMIVAYVVHVLLRIAQSGQARVQLQCINCYMHGKAAPQLECISGRQIASHFDDHTVKSPSCSAAHSNAHIHYMHRCTGEAVHKA